MGDNIRTVFEALVSPLGDYAPEVRGFIVDMHDTKGNDRFQELSIVVPRDMSEAELLGGITETYISQGFIIDGITELLNGCTHAELEAISQINIQEAEKHIRRHYINFEYLPEVLEKYPAQVERIRRQRSGEENA